MEQHSAPLLTALNHQHSCYFYMQPTATFCQHERMLMLQVAFLGEFARRKATSSCLSTSPFVRVEKNSAVAGRIFVKFYIYEFHEKSVDIGTSDELRKFMISRPLWSSGQSFWLQIQRSWVRSPALPDFLSSSGSGTGSTQPREPCEVN